MTALITGIVFALVPASFNRSQIDWRPTTDADNGSLLLTRGSPEQVDVFTSCALIRDGEDGTLLTAGTFKMALTDGVLGVATHTDGAVASIELPTGSCDVRVSYRASTQSLTVTSGDVTDHVTSAAPLINLLHTSDPPRIERVQLLTRPVGVTWSWLRSLIGLLALGLAIAATYVLLRIERERLQVRKWLIPRPRLAPVDAVVGGVLIALTPLVPALLDDGWVLARVRSLTERAWFGNIFDSSDAWLPQALPHEALLAALVGMGASFVHLRIFMALCLVLAWVVLRTCVLSPVVGERASRWPPVAATYLVFSGAWLTTLRAEPVVVLFGVITLAACVAMERRPGPLPVLVGLLATGSAIATHQTGWVCLGPALMLLWAAVRAVLADRQTARLYAAAIAVSGAISIVIMFVAVDLATVADAASSFTAGGGYYHGLLAELPRYTWVFGQDTTGARSFTVLLLLSLGLMATAPLADTDPAQRYLWQISMVWLAGLVLTASKWPWHLGVYAVPATVFATLAARALSRRTAGLPGMAFLFPLVTLAAGVTMINAGGWGYGDLSVRTWADFGALVSGESARRYWYLALLASFGLGFLADHGRLRALTTFAFTLAIVFPLGANLAWLGLDSHEEGWSFAGMNVRQLVGTNTCGVLDEEPVSVKATPLAAAKVNTLSAMDALSPDGFPPVPGLAEGPLEGSVPVWGSWADRDGSGNPDAVTGTLHGPRYRIDATAELTVWSAAGVNEGIGAELVFTDGNDTIDRVPVPLTMDALWSMHTIKVPIGATEVYTEISDGVSGFGGWAALSTPSVAKNDQAKNVFTSKSGFVGPFDSTHYPCLRIPDLSKGYWERVDYMTKPMYFDSGNYFNLTRTQVSCRDNGECLERLNYAMANITVTRRD